MIPTKIKEYLDNYIHQEVYVQISVIKGKEKVSTKVAIESYLNSNHFRDLSEGRPYDHFIDGLNDKCLIKLINSPMKDKQTDDEVIKELQKKLKELSNEELENTFWEIETGEFVNNKQIKELEQAYRIADKEYQLMLPLLEGGHIAQFDMDKQKRKVETAKSELDLFKKDRINELAKCC